MLEYPVADDEAIMANVDCRYIVFSDYLLKSAFVSYADFHRGTE